MGDDVPEGQYTPEIVRAISPAGMTAELVPAPYFAHPAENLRTTALHSIMAGGKYPGAASASAPFWLTVADCTCTAADRPQALTRVDICCDTSLPPRERPGVQNRCTTPWLGGKVAKCWWRVTARTRCTLHHDAIETFVATVCAAGYHNMCRWNFMGMMQHPRVHGLDYYCRMDTDSRIKSKVISPF